MKSGTLCWRISPIPRQSWPRAVRDHLADCCDSSRNDRTARNSSLHFLVGNLNAMRKTLYPGLRHAYDRWVEDADNSQLKSVRGGLDHWKRVARRCLARCQKTDAASSIAKPPENSPL